jgi:hypothetical protein
MIILCDLHSTLLNENEQINDVVADCLRGYAEQKYKICLITAAKLNQQDYEKITGLLKKNKITFINSFYYNDIDTDTDDDVEIKEVLLNKILALGESISLAIDNRKDVCKMYRSHKIDTMRFKESDND